MSQRPIVSLILFTYNQEKYIGQAIKSAFEQTYTPLEIIISDDCSNDKNFEIIQDLVAKYEGAHQVYYYRNSSNLGISKHFSTAVKKAKGKLFVFMAGDDISMPERVSEIYSEWVASKMQAKAFFSNVEIIDQYSNSSGNLFEKIPDYTKNIDEFVKKNSFFDLKPIASCWLLGCSSAVDREVIDSFDKMHPSIIQEDAVLPFRAILLGSIVYIDKVLVLYRRHGNNLYDPNNLKKCIDLQRNQYFIKLQWYYDSQKVKTLSSEIRLVLKKILVKEFIYNIYFRIPFASQIFFRYKEMRKI